MRDELVLRHLVIQMMKPTYGICSSQVFFSLAAVTGCISVIVNMTFPDPPMDCVIDNINGLSVKGGLTASRSFYFGPTYVVEPKGEHQATIVWLHGLGDDGSSTVCESLLNDDRDPCSVYSSIFFMQLVPAIRDPSSTK
ncbi:acyl-protein thioesterase 2-like protein isoform X1, partial [Tanacetum coccineum]